MWGGGQHLYHAKFVYTKRAIQLYKVNLQIMVTFMRGETNQGDDCFDVQPRGKKKSSVPLFI